MAARTGSLFIIMLCLSPLASADGAPALAPTLAVAGRQRRRPLPRWPRTSIIRDLETLRELPRGAPKGVLFVAHGCNHAGSDWWPPSPRCRHCLGLPEEMIVRRAALRRELAVVAVSSYNRTSGCWHNTSPSRSDDLQRLPGVLKQVMQQEARLAGLPLYAFGVSSGGGIVLRLAQIMPEVQGVVAQVVPARPSLLVPDDGASSSTGGGGGSSSSSSSSSGGGRHFPPSLFVHMAQRDPDFAAQIQEALDYCREAGIPADEIQVAPRPVTARLLRRSPLLWGETAEAAVAALRTGGLLDEDGFLLEDPRAEPERWQDALRPALGSLLEGERGMSHVKELLNMAYAKHEISSDSATLSLAWLEAGGQTSIQQLQQQAQEHRRQQQQQQQRRHEGNRRRGHR